MLRFFVRRLFNLVIVLFAMTFVIFALQTLVPGDPARAVLGPTASATAIAAKRRELEIDRPVLVRYLHYMQHLAKGDLGESVHTHGEVAADIAYFLPASIELMATALLMAVALGTCVAIIPIMLPRFTMLRWILIALSSAPIFLTGLLLSLIFWYWLGWLPGGGQVTPDRYLDGPTGLLIIDGLLTKHPGMTMDALRHLILPALTLALPAGAALGRTLGSSLIGVLRQPYIRTARAKGLTEWGILSRHALRNSAAAPLSMFGLQFALMFGNLVVVEQIFAWPGIGLYLLQSFAASDLPAVLGVALVFAVVYLLLTQMLEALQTWLDPRLAART